MNTIDENKIHCLRYVFDPKQNTLSSSSPTRVASADVGQWRRPRPEGLIPLPNHLANAKACAPQTRLRDADSPITEESSRLFAGQLLLPRSLLILSFPPRFARVLLTRSLLTRSLVCSRS